MPSSVPVYMYAACVCTICTTLRLIYTRYVFLQFAVMKGCIICIYHNIYLIYSMQSKLIILVDLTGTMLQCPTRQDFNSQ